MLRSHVVSKLAGCSVVGLVVITGCVDDTANHVATPRMSVLRPTLASAANTEADPVQFPDSIRVSDHVSTAIVRPLVDYPQREFDLSEVYWTVPKSMALADLASRWGLPAKDLKALNPELRGQRRIDEGTSLRVYAANDNAPTHSIGAPNRGRLARGLPIPEGESWTLRPRRNRVYGTTVMVSSLLQAFEAYGAEYPEGESIRLGDLSDRNGGRLSPHKSHRTGRDVDIGYILVPQTRGERYWQRADETSFDVEKNWFLIKALVETGNVQQIFMSSRLQKLIYPLAERELSPEQLGRYFRRANPDPRSPSILKHWNGHLDHMHVRFRCEDGNARCIRRSR